MSSLHLKRPLFAFDRLVTGRLLKRYKRFLADVRLEDGTEVTVHCPNPGRMSSILPQAETIFLSDLRGMPGRRKLGYRWELADVGGVLVVVNTQLANRVAAVLLNDPGVREKMGLPAGGRLVSELTLPGRRSRFDFGLLDEAGSPLVIEVKQVSMRAEERWAAFPDAVTARGKRHLDDLAELSRAGTRTAMLYVVGRTDVDALRPAREVDPEYARAFSGALLAGVSAHACRIRARPDGLYWDGWLPVEGFPVSGTEDSQNNNL